MSSDAFLHRLNQAMMKTHPRPPRNFLTVQQWAQRWGKARFTAGGLIARAVQLKLMKKKDFFVLMNGTGRRVPHYCQVR
jgi:hypothetical protein